MTSPFSGSYAYQKAQKVALESKTYLCRSCEVEWTIPRGGGDTEPCELCGRQTEPGTIYEIFRRGHLPEDRYTGPYDQKYDAGVDGGDRT